MLYIAYDKNNKINKNNRWKEKVSYKECWDEMKLWRSVIETIIGVTDNENNRWKRKVKEKDRKKQRGDPSYSESVRAKWFCCVFKLGFLQLICKASFQVELRVSFINYFKRRYLYESKHVVVECRRLKIWESLSFLIRSSILVLK